MKRFVSKRKKLPVVMHWLSGDWLATVVCDRRQRLRFLHKGVVRLRVRLNWGCHIVRIPIEQGDNCNEWHTIYSEPVVA